MIMIVFVFVSDGLSNLISMGRETFFRQGGLKYKILFQSGHFVAQKISFKLPKAQPLIMLNLKRSLYIF